MHKINLCLLILGHFWQSYECLFPEKFKKPFKIFFKESHPTWIEQLWTTLVVFIWQIERHAQWSSCFCNWKREGIGVLEPGNQLQFYLEKTMKIVQCHPQLDGVHIKATIISCSWIGIRNREVRHKKYQE